ncbi:hypothetical protein SCHPADRAFT_875428 [Schizopora paradoxa]|uniref:PQ-loop-domain-containing protein n=1 Tax=Schizopora paradoxa TaxID=27342 RepID=A0A0H2RL01_9AGAM|nr:hypothetical protein SCHPADRAFT_875428 [Schizopora paradoxa]
MSSSDTCEPHHDWFGSLLTAGLVVGLIVSYLPQHFRIISKGSSEGFSPWFLLLGATSSAAGMLNMWTLQWGIVKCCKKLSFGSCVESLGGIFQVSTQWFMFTMILVLYMIYFPPHLKYAVATIDTHDMRGIQHVKTNVKTDTWRLSITLSWVVVVHMAFITAVTFFLLTSTTPSPEGVEAHNAQIAMWATFLGVSSAVLAAIQYCPQIFHTFRLKLVGALSIPMMCIQSPGAALMVLSIALRPGTDWTSWIMFAVSGVMQATLLIMCIAWKFRQRRLHIDDFGHPLPLDADDPSAPLLVAGDAGLPVSNAMGQAMRDEVYEDEAGMQEEVSDIEIVRAMLGENTPLLKGGRRRNTAGSGGSSGSRGKGWFKAIRRASGN